MDPQKYKRSDQSKGNQIGFYIEHKELMLLPNEIWYMILDLITPRNTPGSKIWVLYLSLTSRRSHVIAKKYLEHSSLKITRADQPQFTTYLASSGHLAALQYAHENHCQWSKDTCAEAALHGHLATLHYAHENGASWNEDTCVNAAKNGHLKCLEYAILNGCIGPNSLHNTAICREAAAFGHVDCLAFAHENGCEWNEHATTNAAMHGQIDCLKYIHEKGGKWDGWTMTLTASKGQLECLKYMHENGCPWHDEITIAVGRFCLHRWPG
eukprot:TRINITY_DN8077_c0_g1_i1.p1 TRINITY_DN8077_c0_g1~~TRINITY_DN8077_c0_g1_i1.p1  ORF type:complete len:268 (-),score=20.16 TRINITY_DN8077_c0_g1_i1:83-886(-)